MSLTGKIMPAIITHTITLDLDDLTLAMAECIKQHYEIKIANNYFVSFDVDHNEAVSSADRVYKRKG